MGSAGFIDRAHATLGNLGDDLVGTNPLRNRRQDVRGHRQILIVFSPPSEGFGVHPEQFDAASQVYFTHPPKAADPPSPWNARSVMAKKTVSWIRFRVA